MRDSINGLQSRVGRMIELKVEAVGGREDRMARGLDEFNRAGGRDALRDLMAEAGLKGQWKAQLLKISERIINNAPLWSSFKIETHGVVLWWKPQGKRPFQMKLIVDKGKDLTVDEVAAKLLAAFRESQGLAEGEDDGTVPAQPEPERQPTEDDFETAVLAAESIHMAPQSFESPMAFATAVAHEVSPDADPTFWLRVLRAAPKDRLVQRGNAWYLAETPPPPPSRTKIDAAVRMARAAAEVQAHLKKLAELSQERDKFLKQRAEADEGLERIEHQIASVFGQMPGKVFAEAGQSLAGGE